MLTHVHERHVSLCLDPLLAREHVGSAAEIDIYFGWHERVLLKEMQRHYEGMSRRARMRQARITSMI
mgnify:CR=1 FL=1